MPLIRHCINYEFCNGYADGDDHLCQYCREVAEKAQREKVEDRKYQRDTQKRVSLRKWLNWWAAK